MLTCVFFYGIGVGMGMVWRQVWGIVPDWKIGVNYWWHALRAFSFYEVLIWFGDGGAGLYAMHCVHCAPDGAGG